MEGGAALIDVFHDCGQVSIGDFCNREIGDFSIYLGAV